MADPSWRDHTEQPYGEQEALRLHRERDRPTSLRVLGEPSLLGNVPDNGWVIHSSPDAHNPDPCHMEWKNSHRSLVDPQNHDSCFKSLNFRVVGYTGKSCETWFSQAFQTWHCTPLRPHNSVWWGPSCALQDVYQHLWAPLVSYQEHPPCQLRQPKLSPDTATCPWGRRNRHWSRNTGGR